MKTISKLVSVLSLLILLGCIEKHNKKEKGFSYEEKNITSKTTKIENTIPPSKQIHLNNKGFGPIKVIHLDTKINQKIADHGKNTFKKLCAACHKTDKKFIGPAPKNILDRRSPEWVMNIMLNPIEMIKKDPLAKALQEEFNGAIMPKQTINETDARALLEYFRTL